MSVKPSEKHRVQIKVKIYQKPKNNRKSLKMNMKTKLIACLVLLSTFIATQCSPIDFLSQLTDEGERMLMKRLEDYLNSDYSDDSSSSTYSNGVQTRGVTARQENCRLPMKRGLCRALLPRFRYVWSMNFKIDRFTRPIIIKKNFQTFMHNL